MTSPAELERFDYVILFRFDQTTSATIAPTIRSAHGSLLAFSYRRMRAVFRDSMVRSLRRMRRAVSRNSATRSRLSEATDGVPGAHWAFLLRRDRADRRARTDICDAIAALARRRRSVLGSLSVGIYFILEPTHEALASRRGRLTDVVIGSAERKLRHELEAIAPGATGPRSNLADRGCPTPTPFRVSGPRRRYASGVNDTARITRSQAHRTPRRCATSRRTGPGKPAGKGTAIWTASAFRPSGLACRRWKASKIY